MIIFLLLVLIFAVLWPGVVRDLVVLFLMGAGGVTAIGAMVFVIGSTFG